MTLTEASRFTKKAALAFAAFLVAAIAFWTSYRYWYTNYYIPRIEAAKNKPDVRFGALPSLNLPKSQVSSSTLTYSIDTETGNLPNDLQTTAKIFYIPQNPTTLLSANKARDIASSVGFTSYGEATTPTTLKFTDGGGEMTIDINSSNFHFRKPLTPDSTNTYPFSETQLTADLKSYLNARHLLTDSLDQGLGRAYMDQGVNGSSATVTLWPADVEKLPIVTPSFRYGLVKATFIRGADGNLISQMDYIYWGLDETNTSSYPLKGVSKALDDLKAGAGSVIVSPRDNHASINKVYLAYFEEERYNPFLQPIYVFQGSDFIAYVSAVSDEYVK